MNYKLRTFLTVTLLALVIAGSVQARTFVSDPQLPDTVRVDSVRALQGSHVAVPVYVFMDEPLSGVEITLTPRSPYVTLDSFSFQGSILSYLELKGSIILDSGISAYAFPYSDFFIYPGHGLFGKVYLTVMGNATTGPILIDSTTITVELVDHSTWFSDLDLQTFIPQYRAGMVDLQDSCCVGQRGNIDGSADDGVDISDLTILINYLFLVFDLQLPCPEEADVSPEAATVEIDISDLTRLVQYLFIDLSTPLPGCL